MEEDLYDEYGNYIGPTNVEDEHLGAQFNGSWDQYGTTEALDVDEKMNDTFVQHDANITYQVVLPDDKQMFPDASELYHGVDVLIQEEDAQTLSDPIVTPQSHASHIFAEDSVPDVLYSEKMVASLQDHPAFHRLVSVQGGWHHGKSSFIDIFVHHTHRKPEWSRGMHNSPYLDSLRSEQERETTLSCKPMTVLVPSSEGKSHIVTLMDSPGHLDFTADVVLASRATDCALVVVDAVEGVTKPVEVAIAEAVAARQQIVLVINKLDRLIVEARLPPRDAYRKLVLLIEQFNAVIVAGYSGVDHPPFVSPLNNTVLFVSSLHQWVFSLESFASIYKSGNSKFSSSGFAKKLWGNVYLQNDRSITPTLPYKGAPNTFVQFVWEPLCKLYSTVFGTDDDAILQFCSKYKITVSDTEVVLPSEKQFPVIASRFFVNPCTVLCDTLLQVTTSPLTGNGVKSLQFTAPTDSKEFKGVALCDKKAPLVLHTLCHCPLADARSWGTLVRVMSGTLELNSVVRFFGSDYSNNPENTFSSTINSIQLMQGGRYAIPLSRAPAGCIVLINGVEAANSVYTGVHAESAYSGHFLPLRTPNPAHFRLAIEPLVPTQLSKLLHALKLVRYFYSALRVHTEESGEIVLTGTGELYLDAVMHDIRTVYGELEVRVSDPYVSLCETVQDRSELQCRAKTQFEGKKQSTVVTLAEPLDEYISQDIDQGQYDHVDGFSDTKELGLLFQERYQWDVLESRNIWTFGGKQSPNVQVNESLRNRNRAQDGREACVDGFLWAMREGPLIQEPVRGAKVKITDLELAEEALYRTRKHIVPVARKAVYAALLMAKPRLLEPLQQFQILCREGNMEVVNKVLGTRRAYITEKRNVPGTPFVAVSGHVPLLEICGMETDLRVNTRGQAQIQTSFARWETVPGDPMDKEASLKPQIVAPNYMLARDLLLKIRRRKGLSEDVDVARYFDEEMLLELAAHLAQDE